MVRDKNFYKLFFSMALILILQNVITLSVNLADNIMLGGYSEVSLSGVAAANQIQFVYQQILQALAEGIVVLGGQYYGKGDIGSLKRIAAFATRTAAALSVVLFIAVSLFPHQLLGLFTTDEAIIQEGMRYISLMRFSYLIFAVIQLLLGTLRSIGVVKIAPVLSVCSLLINCSINYTLIYGHFGAPRLGVVGAAIGTVTARVVELLVLLLFIRKTDKILNLKPSDYLVRDPLLQKDYLKVTTPMLIVSSLWGLNQATQNAILGHMTARAIAANSVASTMFMMVKSAAVGASSASAYLISKTIGEGNMDKLKQYAKTLQILFIGVGLVSGIVLFLIRMPILSLYRLEPETRQMAEQFLLILSLIVVTMSYQMPTNMGIARAGGATRYAMIMDLISIWGIVIPVSFFMAFWVKASPVVVIWCLNADQIFKCVPAFLKVNFGHWARKLTRE